MTAETCPTCATPLEDAREGWIQLVLTRNTDGLRVAFYGRFSEMIHPRGIFAWVGEQCRVPDGFFCPRGHIGLSKEGRAVR